MLPPHMPRKMVLPLKALQGVFARTARTFVLPHIRVFVVSQGMADEVLLELECRFTFLADVAEREVLVVSQLMPPIVVSSRGIEWRYYVSYFSPLSSCNILLHCEHWLASKGIPVKGMPV